MNLYFFVKCQDGGSFKVKFILFPFFRVIDHIIDNILAGFFIPDNMVVETRLPLEISMAVPVAPPFKGCFKLIDNH
jgi:hypothetical protein